MQINLNNTPEQIELIKAMGSKSPTVAREATEAVATFLGPVIHEVLMTAGTVSRIYKDVSYDEDSDPSIPLDLFYNDGAGYVTVCAQNMAGGMPSSQVEGVKELKFGTYRLDSAVSFNKKYARKSRLDVISKAIERMVNEVLIKQERNGWAVVLKALAEARTPNVTKGVLGHLLTGGDTSNHGLLLSDLNSLMTLIKRINESYSGNTPVQPFSNGITDLYISPEVKQSVRAFSYNPINTTASASSGAEIPRNQFLSENMRDEIYKNGGMQSIYGVNLIELLEFGPGQKYNALFSVFNAAVSGNPSFVAATNQIAVGIDNTRGVFLRPVARQAESGGTFSVMPDGQFDMYGSRVEKVGFYGFLEEGRVCLDARAVAGLIL